MAHNQKPARVAVIGCGAFGRNHLRVYNSQPGTQLVAAVDHDPAARTSAAKQYNIPTYAAIGDLLASHPDIDAVSICTPTTHHAAAAIACMEVGIDVLVEKPIAASLDEADEMLTAAAQHNRILQVGHLERFNPAVTAALPLRNRPMFFESHRLSIFTPRSLDVDVVLDLMIHDLDIVLTLAASPVREVRAVGLPVLSQKTDIANVRVEFESGAVANFTASRVSTERVRKLRFFQPHQYLSLDFARQDLLMIDVTAAASLTPQQMQALFAAAAAAPTASPKGVDEASAKGADGNAEQHPTPGLSLRKVPVENGEPLTLEIAAFLEAVRTRNTPQVSGQDGRAALALALEINAAIAEHAKHAGLS